MTATYSAVLSITDSGGYVQSDTIDVIVENSVPVVDAGPGASVQLGGTFSLSGHFFDPGQDSWTATVNFGDNSADQPLALNADKSFVLNHVY